MQHVLIIGKVWPEPNSSAAGSRTMQLIEQFMLLNWEISFACTAGESEYRSDIESLGIKKYNIELNSSSFDDFIKELSPGIVVFDRFATEEQFGWRVAENCPDALRILDTIDLHCLREARHKALKQKREFDLNDLLSDLAKREIASIYRCDLSLMISAHEIFILKEHFKIDQALLHYTPFLLDPLTEKEMSAWPGFAERQHFMSIGNFLHEPNWDAVLYLKQQIWPLIRKKLPKAELHIYGAYPSHKVFQIHDPKEGFLIKGRAGSAEEVVKKARVLLAPLRFGAGMKGKLVDAMLYGTPSVTTSIGAESMHDHLNWNGFITDDTQTFAEYAIELYNNETLWKKCQYQGKEIVDKVFLKAEHGKKLINRVLSVQENLSTHRQQNFIGAMFQQQNASATKYMSLWIEAKNKKD